MLRLFHKLSSNFCQKNPRSQLLEQLSGSLDDIVKTRKAIRKLNRQNQQQTSPAQFSPKYLFEHQVRISLYMKHDCQKCHYIFNLMNYYKIGFKKYSGLQTLDRVTYFEKTRDVPEELRFPLVKVIVALNPKDVMRGVNQIQEFMFVSKLFQGKPIERNSPQIDGLQQYIDQQLKPSLESLFWHPILTYQYTFHGTSESYVENAQNYQILQVIRRNWQNVISRSFKNIYSIFTQRQRYLNSKDNLLKVLRELQTQYLSKKSFFGGQEPNHIDFYLYSLLKAKSNSQSFMWWIENRVKGDIWGWWKMMGKKCQYSKDRITLV